MKRSDVGHLQRVVTEIKRLQRYIPPEKTIVPYNEDDAQGQRILNSVIAMERSDSDQDVERSVCLLSETAGFWSLYDGQPKC